MNVEATSTTSIYKPLETPTTIRLLSIHKDDDNYKYSISHQDLDKKPFYVAISYTWVNDANETILLVDGIEFKVSSNVESALHRLHNRMGEFAKPGSSSDNVGIDIWIDQICIDQSNSPMALRERAAQIKIMDRIYSSALMVAADLGPEQFFDGLLIPLLAHEEPFSWERARAHIKHISGGRATVTIRHVQEALKQFVQRRFFTRAWILQEFVLNAVTAFIIGEFTYSADRIVRNAVIGVTQMLDPEGGDLTQGLEDGGLDTYHSFMTMSLLRLIPRWDLREAAGERPKFSEIVKLSCRLNATKQHDKVYGCLALSDQSFRSSFEVDYTESLDDLSRRVVRALISHERRVDILYQAKFLSASGNQCSWSLETSPTQLWGGISGRTFGTVKEFDASAGTFQTSTLRAESSPEKLLLDGNIVDEVIHLTLRFWEYGSTYPMIQQYHRLLAMIDSPHSRSVDGFWRTIIQDQVFPNNNGNPLTRTTPRDIAYYLCWLCVKQRKTGILYNDYLRRSVKRLGNIYENSLTSFLRDRRLCITATGRIGGVPATAVPGDMITILRGGDRPFVLRLDGGDFRLVGSCYVHGLMDGEAMNEVGNASQIALV